MWRPQVLLGLALAFGLVVSACQSSQEVAALVCSDFEDFGPECADFQGGREQGYRDYQARAYDDGYGAGYKDGEVGTGWDYYGHGLGCGKDPSLDLQHALYQGDNAKYEGDEIVFKVGYDFLDGYDLGSYEGCEDGYENGYREGFRVGGLVFRLRNP